MSSVLPINNLVPLLVSGVALVSAVAAYQVGKTSSGKDNKTEAPPPVIPSVIKQTDEVALVSAWLARFEAALKAGNINEVLSLFGDDCYWRDLLTFTWNIYTSEGKEEIRKMLQSCLDNTKPSNWRLTGTPTVDPQFNTVDAFFSFETALARADGHIRLKDGRCWTLLTTMQELKGHEEKKGPSRPRGTVHGVHKDRKSWLAQKEEEERTLGFEKQPYVVIIGGGQGGIGLGARLKQLGVPTIIVDKHKRPGDQWRSRYKSLCLHDPVWYDHLPYLPFPAHWPIYCPKDKIGDWLEMYTKIMELNYWSSTECLKASFDEDTKEWTVTVDKEGETVVLRPKHLIFALGVSGFPNIPTFKGSDTFKGDQHHSSAHSGGDSYKGKKVVVIGGNNSAHDICADLYEHGVDVTMIQRTSTHIIRADTMMEVVFKPLYSEEAVDAGITTHKADLLFASMPFKIMHKFQIPIYEQVKQHDKEFYDKLRKRGFILDFGDDDSGLFLKYLRRGSGYYIDVGASELIVNGSIKLKSGVQISRIDPHSVVMADGTEIPADVIVYATGYNSMTEWVSKLVSQGVADKVGKCWGLGSNTTKDPGPWEGELRNMWKPTLQENMWFHGGNLHQSRHYSKYVSLQLKARMEGIKTPVYGLGNVHHLR